MENCLYTQLETEKIQTVKLGESGDTTFDFTS